MSLTVDSMVSRSDHDTLGMAYIEIFAPIPFVYHFRYIHSRYDANTNTLVHISMLCGVKKNVFGL